MQPQTASITIRIDHELMAWLKEQTAQQNCKLSDLVREAILNFKATRGSSEELTFSPSFQAKAAKAAIMNYRLMELLANELVENGKELIAVAANSAKGDLDKWQIS